VSSLLAKLQGIRRRGRGRGGKWTGNATARRGQIQPLDTAVRKQAHSHVATRGAATEGRAKNRVTTMRVGKGILDMPLQKHGRERDRPSQRAQNVCALANKISVCIVTCNRKKHGHTVFCQKGNTTRNKSSYVTLGHIPAIPSYRRGVDQL
jgi:hypothetical protein